MRKINDFFVTQIFRESSFWYSRSAKSAILTQLEELNFDFHECLHFLKAKINQINTIQSLLKLEKLQF